MATKQPFLGVPYGGYLHRDVPREDDELTHVGPGTPCGEYLRRFWQPVVLLDELQDVPVRIRVMGEDLVVFRDRSGQIGVLELHCCHRGVSLEYAQIGQKGLRCCYHGWLYDVDGRILDTPGEPPGSKLKDRLFHGAYPTQVYKGLVFVYMGPPEHRPAFPIYDTYDMPGYRPWSGIRHALPCNWLQIKENCMDPAHLSYLHTLEGNGGFAEELKLKNELDYMPTPIGMVYVDSRRVDDKIWVRMADFICPNIHQFGKSAIDFTRETRRIPPMMTQWSVPIDDTHTMNFRMKHVRLEEKPGPATMPYGQEAGPYDERQRAPGDYDAQVSQRATAIHALEHLGATDRGVVMLRTMIRDGIRAVQDGRPVKGLGMTWNDAIPTYGNDALIKVAPAAEPDTDRRLVWETGRKIAEERIASPLR